MKNQEKPSFVKNSSFFWAALTLCLTLFGLTTRLSADVLIVESRGGLNFSEYSDSGFTNSSIKSTAPGCTPGIGCRFGNVVSCTITLLPAVGVAGGIYEFDQTHAAASSTSVDIMVNVAVTGGVFTNYAGGGTNTTNNIWTTAFQGTGTNANVWKVIGNIQLNPGVSQPTIVMTTTNTDLSSTTARFVSDGYRFTYTGDPCLQGLPELYAINGPLFAGQTNVTVPAVSGSATNVNVYANGVLAGHAAHAIVTNSTVTVIVPTTALQKGSFITATETGTNGIESCNNSQGTEVGGGPNPQIRFSLSLDSDPSLAGPSGAAGTSSLGNYFFLGATGSAGLGGFGTAPGGGTVIFPSTNWQTVTFTPFVDTGYYWAGAFSTSTSLEQDSFAQLDSIACCIDDLSDTGPFQVYIDDIMNGTNIIQNFEKIPAGTVSAQFSAPGTSSTTSGDLLAQPPGVISPNTSQVVSVLSPTGTNSALVSWQFNGTANVNWVRLSFGGSAGGAATFPQVDLSQPISFNVLLEPVGVTAPLPPGSVAPPTLTTAVTNSTLTLNWSGTFYLQVTTNLSPSGWSDVGVSNAPYSIIMTNGTHLFYRLSQKP